ncbi:3-oxoacyl-[acyl-carrier-protein] synthase III C-terminal domain-containing protein [Nocardia sp. NPDC101769]|uniref:3-oxoacyl-[acyl-carrier-protein] synthase III C-terminal domain-containing protein n=1 Tax=Nocardia sp. NPDC101769 TaxID=3364333 RepID=UPI003821B4DC
MTATKQRPALLPEDARSALADYGNCAGPMILLALKLLLAEQRPAPGSYGVLLAFGPSLTIESTLLRS